METNPRFQVNLYRGVVGTMQPNQELGRVPFASPSHWPALATEADVTAMRKGRNPFAEPEPASRSTTPHAPEPITTANQPTDLAEEPIFGTCEFFLTNKPAFRTLSLVCLKRNVTHRSHMMRTSRWTIHLITLVGTLRGGQGTLRGDQVRCSVFNLLD